MMKLNTKLTTWGLLATLTVGGIAPALADGYRDRSSDQTNKNNARNLTIGAAAVAVYGLFSHNNAATLLGAAGAALAGSQYEKDRQQQSQDHNQYYYRDGQNGNNGWNGSDGRNWQDGRNGNNGRTWNNGNRDNGDHDYDHQDSHTQNYGNRDHSWNR